VGGGVGWNCRNLRPGNVRVLSGGGGGDSASALHNAKKTKSPAQVSPACGGGGSRPMKVPNHTAIIEERNTNLQHRQKKTKHRTTKKYVASERTRKKSLKTKMTRTNGPKNKTCAKFTANKIQKTSQPKATKSRYLGGLAG